MAACYKHGTFIFNRTLTTSSGYVREVTNNLEFVKNYEFQNRETLKSEIRSDSGPQRQKYQNFFFAVCMTSLDGQGDVAHPVTIAQTRTRYNTIELCTTGDDVDFSLMKMALGTYGGIGKNDPLYKSVQNYVPVKAGTIQTRAQKTDHTKCSECQTQS